MQRLCEVETYRMMALLALPLARRHGGELSRLGERLRGIIDEMTDCARLEDEQRLLGELTDVSAGIERISAETNYRFSAARAYYALVQRRIQELREERIEGFQTIQEFMDRRLSPAMRTCESTQDRLDTLSRRVARAGQLLRTRVDVTLEAQNRDLLESMNRRAKLQLRLQETVEGLSVAAISYYLVSLVKYLAEGGESFGLPLTPNQITAPVDPARGRPDLVRHAPGQARPAPGATGGPERAGRFGPRPAFAKRTKGLRRIAASESGFPQGAFVGMQAVRRNFACRGQYAASGNALLRCCAWSRFRRVRAAASANATHCRSFAPGPRGDRKRRRLPISRPGAEPRGSRHGR